MAANNNYYNVYSWSSQPYVNPYMSAVDPSLFGSDGNYNPYSDAAIFGYTGRDLLGSELDDKEARAAMWQNRLSWLQELNTRDYNAQQTRELRDYDNQYNSPAAQVARLMQTGMTREAALAAVAGAASSGVSGMAPAANPGVAGFDPTLSENLFNQQVSTAIGGISSLSSVAMSAAQLGMQMPLFKGQAGLLGAQNWVAQKNNEGYTEANNLMNLLDRGRECGLLNMNEPEYQSLPAAIDRLREIANTPIDPTENHLSALYKSVLKQYFGDGSFSRFNTNPFARSNAESMFNSMWGTADMHKSQDVVDIMKDNLVKSNTYMYYQNEDIATKINLQREQIATELVNRGYLRAQTSFLGKQGDLVDVQTELTDAMVTGQHIQNAYDDQAYELFRSLSAVEIAEAGVEFEALMQIGNDQLIQDRVTKYCNDTRKAEALAAVAISSSAFEADFIENHKGAMAFGMWLDKSGVGKILGEATTIGAMLLGGKFLKGAAGPGVTFTQAPFSLTPGVSPNSVPNLRNPNRGFGAMSPGGLAPGLF